MGCERPLPEDVITEKGLRNFPRYDTGPRRANSPPLELASGHDGNGKSRSASGGDRAGGERVRAFACTGLYAVRRHRRPGAMHSKYILVLPRTSRTLRRTPIFLCLYRALQNFTWKEYFQSRRSVSNAMNFCEVLNESCLGFLRSSCNL